jgi:hypothetical protein
MGMGDGQDTIVGKHIADTAAAAPFLAAFTAMCRGKVTSITMYGCNVAEGAGGEAFVQDVATRANCSVTAYSGAVTISTRWFFGTYYRYSASDNGRAVTKSP